MPLWFCRQMVLRFARVEQICLPTSQIGPKSSKSCPSIHFHISILFSAWDGAGIVKLKGGYRCKDPLWCSLGRETAFIHFWLGMEHRRYIHLWDVDTNPRQCACLLARMIITQNTALLVVSGHGSWWVRCALTPRWNSTESGFCGLPLFAFKL